MIKKKSRNLCRKLRHRGIRKNIQGSESRLRLNVFRSLTHIYAQLINDQKQETVLAVSTLTPEVRKKVDGMSKVEKAKVVGRLIAQKSLEKGINQIVFDRGGYLYHGRVRALAEGAREGGLKF